MLRVEVLGRADAEAIASQLKALDRSGLLLVTTRPRPAELASAVALVVAAPSLIPTISAIDLTRNVDVVFAAQEPLDTQVASLWSGRLAGFARALAGEPVASSAAQLHPYDHRWAPAAYRRLRRLQVALAPAEGSAEFRFDHIGSTSVPGLHAKPVLDLQIRVPELSRDEDFDAMLRKVGYRPARGSRPDSPGVYLDIPRGSQPVDERVWDKRLFICPDPEQAAILHIRLMARPGAATPSCSLIGYEPARLSAIATSELSRSWPVPMRATPTTTITPEPRAPISTWCNRSSSAGPTARRAESAARCRRSQRDWCNGARLRAPADGRVASCPI